MSSCVTACRNLSAVVNRQQWIALKDNLPPAAVVLFIKMWRQSRITNFADNKNNKNKITQHRILATEMNVVWFRTFKFSKASRKPSSSSPHKDVKCEFTILSSFILSHGIILMFEA